MTRLVLPAAVAGVFAAAWLSQGTLAVTFPDGPRIALLPLSLPALGAAIAVGAVVVAAVWLRASLVPLWLLTLVVLAWILVPVPAAFLAWSGNNRCLVWIVVALLV